VIIKIARYFTYPDLRRQTPNGDLKWNDFTFTEDDIEECDYLVILDYPKMDFSIKVKKTNIIHICLEPPNEISKYRQYGNKQSGLIINQLSINENNMLSHGALPWHINKDFDFLSRLGVSELTKSDKIAWITSNQRSSVGHGKRMVFLDRIKTFPFVDLYGRGINPVEDKWNVLSSSKFAIAYENFQNDYYWTEKIVDCFLSYTMPIYFGCNNILNFFPKNSMIQLDPKEKNIELYLKDVINSKQWEKNLDAINEARNLILYEYQLFPFLYKLINDLENKKGHDEVQPKEIVSFKGGNAYFDNYPFSVILEKNIFKLKRKLFNSIIT